MVAGSMVNGIMPGLFMLSRYARLGGPSRFGGCALFQVGCLLLKYLAVGDEGLTLTHGKPFPPILARFAKSRSESGRAIKCWRPGNVRFALAGPRLGAPGPQSGDAHLQAGLILGPPGFGQPGVFRLWRCNREGGPARFSVVGSPLGAGPPSWN
jgi:hypothetical protein